MQRSVDKTRLAWDPPHVHPHQQNLLQPERHAPAPVVSHAAWDPPHDAAHAHWNPLRDGVVQPLHRVGMMTVHDAPGADPHAHPARLSTMGKGTSLLGVARRCTGTVGKVVLPNGKCYSFWDTKAHPGATSGTPRVSLQEGRGG
eukprot:5829912-Prymnesium_polylepis.1